MKIVAVHNLRAPSVLIMIIGLVAVAGCGREEKKVATKEQTVKLSKEVEDVITRKIALFKHLAADPLVIKSVRQTNDKNRGITQKTIKTLDEKWSKTAGLDEFITSFITNPCAKFLAEFQKANPGFPEIFITDENGLIVAETNKTSDYYQADEAWWISAYDHGRGKSYYGNIEYDESSQIDSIPLFVPVIDPDTKKAIGIIKAVCNISSIRTEL